MNRDLMDDGTKMRALKIKGLIPEDAALRIKKESDIPTLKELRISYLLEDKEALQKVVEARLGELGAKY